MSTASPPVVLQARKLTKDFGHHKGIFGVDVALSEGEIVGFIGPNGAGKSTTINILTGLIRADRGTFKLFGKKTDSASIYKLMPHLGILYSEPTLDTDVSAKRLFKRNQKLMGRDCTAQWQRLSSELGLDIDKKIGQLSLGNKKKVGIVNAMMHMPRLLIMDEPTSGLDPLVRTSLLRLLEEFAAQGGAVLLSSHDLGEVQQICHRVTMIKEGKVVLNESTEQLLQRAARNFRLVRPPATTVEALAKIGVSVVHQGGGELAFQAKDYGTVIKTITQTGFYDFYVEHPSLAEAFAEEYR
jgi:ABC-2 type transport system ATP-binding protein